MAGDATAAQGRAAAEALFYAATERLSAGDAAQAQRLYRQALQADPALAEAHANLAYLEELAGEAEQALDHYRQALALNPDLAQVLVNYGALLASQQCLDAAESAYRRALLLDASLVSAWSNLGALLGAQGRDAEAEHTLRQALALDPQHRSARINLAYVLLRQGRWHEGWPYLEARDWYGALQGRLTCPLWQGEALAGRSILVTFEAGHGDVIHFSRYVAWLKDAGAVRVDLLCQPGLCRLMTRLPGVDRVMTFDAPWPTDDWDYWVPLLSLPGRFQTRVDHLPATIPYLFADDAAVARWRERLPVRDGALRVGLAWKGNPRLENDAQRSLPNVQLLRPLWDVPGVRFFSLQKAAGEDELAREAHAQPMAALGPEVQDFADTAAVLRNLDLVITVDTALAHLAGALGTPCWVLLPAYLPDWRWLQQRTDSPWYPGVMRLFRQERVGDWVTPICHVQAALRVRAARW
jgi:Tfp pilus assembly protein PilF